MKRIQPHPLQVLVLALVWTGACLGVGPEGNPLDGADPFDFEGDILVPAAHTSPRNAILLESGMALSLAGVETSSLLPRVDRSRVWYDASSRGVSGDVPVVKDTGILKHKVPQECIPWSGSDFRLHQCGMAFPSSTNYPKPHGLAPWRRMTPTYLRGSFLMFSRVPIERHGSGRVAPHQAWRQSSLIALSKSANGALESALSADSRYAPADMLSGCHARNSPRGGL